MNIDPLTPAIIGLLVYAISLLKSTKADIEKLTKLLEQKSGDKSPE
jgi:hypothetical protein